MFYFPDREACAREDHEKVCLIPQLPCVSLCDQFFLLGQDFYNPEPH